MRRKMHGANCEVDHDARTTPAPHPAAAANPILARRARLGGPHHAHLAAYLGAPGRKRIAQRLVVNRKNVRCWAVPPVRERAYRGRDHWRARRPGPMVAFT